MARPLVKIEHLLTTPVSHRYYLGIIDILQEFNMGKRMESAYKQRLQVPHAHTLSLSSLFHYVIVHR